jgi:hypothetical protein
MVTAEKHRKWQFQETVPVTNVSWQPASRRQFHSIKRERRKANLGSLVSLKGLTRYLQHAVYDYIPQELAHPKIKVPFQDYHVRKKSPSGDCSSTQLHKPTKSLFRSACYLLLGCNKNGEGKGQGEKREGERGVGKK